MGRHGILALPVAGLLYLMGGLLRGAYVLPTASTARVFAEWATKATCTAGYFVLIAAAITSVFGYFALGKEVRSRTAKPAMVLSIVGISFLLVLFGGVVVLLPAIGRAYLGNQVGDVMIAARVLEGGTMSAIGAGLFLNIVGHFLFAVGIWRTPSLPKLAAVPFVLGPIGMCMPFLYPIELGGFVLYFIASALIAARITTNTQRAERT